LKYSYKETFYSLFVENSVLLYIIRYKLNSADNYPQGGYIMNKGIIVAAISMSALSLGINTNESYAQEVGTITASSLNVRAGAGTNYSKIATVSKGNTVEIISSSNGWYKIKLSNGKIGWVSSQYVSKGKTTSTTTQASQGQAKVTASSLNVRKSPSTSGAKVGSLSNGQIVTILEKSGTWSKIKTSSGLIGWVSNSYLTSNTSQTTQAAPTRGVGRAVVVELAYKQLGKKYVWGAEGPNSFDCSGLTYYVYKNALGKTIPRTSAAQSKYGQYVPKGELQSGDLVFSGANGKVSHVGIYIGNGKMIHSPQTGDVVKISEINSGYYKDRYITSRRP
jgi:cell wall-associated NlpC family hydrolase